jgi:hypothetical protein
MCCGLTTGELLGHYFCLAASAPCLKLSVECRVAQDAAHRGDERLIERHQRTTGRWPRAVD